MLSEEKMDALVNDCLKITEGKKHPFAKDSHVWSDMEAVVNLVLLRAQADVQPVAVVGSDFQLVWIGSGPIAPIIAKHNINVGDQLFACASLEALTPIDMVLHCPNCGLQHIDEPEKHDVTIGHGENKVAVDEIVTWENPPHRSHLCHGCGHIWRPADVATNGVRSIKTKGKNDSPAPEAAQALSDTRIDWIANTHCPGGTAYPNQVKNAIREALKEAANGAATVAEPSGDIRQLTDWLMVDAVNGEQLYFAGPLEKEFCGLSRVMLQSKSGAVWTLTAGLKEGYKTESQRLQNIREVAQEQPEQIDLQSIEQYRMQMAGISTAAQGYWKEDDPIHPDYDTVALRDVAKLYAKYDALYKSTQQQAELGARSARIACGLEPMGGFLPPGATKVVQHAEPVGDERAKCQHCHGLGIAAIIGRTEVTCAACGGVGYWHGEESGYGDIDCDACGGTGKQTPTDTEAVARALCESVAKRSDCTAGELWNEYRSEFMEDACAASAVIAAQSGQRAGMPTYRCDNVRVKSMSDGNVMVTMLAKAFEPAPQYDVQPVNPSVVRANDGQRAGVAEDAARFVLLVEGALATIRGDVLTPQQKAMQDGLNDEDLKTLDEVRARIDAAIAAAPTPAAQGGV